MGSKLEHKTSRKIRRGKYYPLGADLQEGGVNFALYSERAEQVYLLLFDRPDSDPADVIKLENRTKFIWHCFVQGLKAGQLYGYKVRGEYNPGQGLRFNENKLLLDPYSKAVSHELENTDSILLGYDRFSPLKDLEKDTRDSTRVCPKSMVVDDSDFDWQGDVHPDFPLDHLIIYEAHLKGFTAHPSSEVEHPGTYPGFIEKIPWLKHLGVNAVELLPVHEFCTEDALRHKGLSNYWGYNTVSFFAPELNYGTKKSPGCQVNEFKTLVRELHKAGMELILDVVYNHTCEGNELGPTVCLRGIDNTTYYCLKGDAKEPRRYYQNFTGCGNSLNLANPPVIRLVLDSLRYWAEHVHVDGFRFDLASVLGREGGDFQKCAAFFDVVAQDPVLCKLKLIAEPWDIGTCKLGDFPVDWSEWNGQFRDTLRGFGRGEPGQLRPMGFRLTGSADLYSDDGRSPCNSINFITCHDGFTLHDLVSYDKKHNQANLEFNRDGAEENFSWNCGVEGPTDNPQIVRLRKQQAKNFFCWLFFSAGTPMMLGGDEFLRTQNGNNNAFCQDNETNWFDWSLASKNAELVEFCRKAIALSKTYSVLKRREFLSGKDLDGNHVRDIEWFAPDGNPLNWDDWQSRTLCYQLDGSEQESELGDYQFFFILNADFNLKSVRLPRPGNGKKWRRIVDTSLDSGRDFVDPGKEVLIDPPEQYLANPRSTVVLVTR